jgi:DNA-binding protein H-NS
MAANTGCQRGNTRMTQIMKQLREEAAAQSESDLAQANATIGELRGLLTAANSQINDLNGQIRANARARAKWAAGLRQVAEDLQPIIADVQPR